MGRETGAETGNRGVSHLVGTIMIVGLVVTVGVIVILMGFSAVQMQQADLETERAEETMLSLDSQITDAATSQERRAISLPEASEVNKLSVVKAGNVTVELNNGTCTERVPLTSLRYTLSENRTLAFEGGAVWRSIDGAVIQVSPPDLEYQERTISFRLVNVTGAISGTGGSVTPIKNLSRTRTNAIDTELFRGNCARPNTVSITIESDYYRGWGEYLQSEFEAPVSYDHPNGSVSMFLNQSYLPEEANDERNLVVNYSDWNGSVTAANVFDIDKGANNTYPTGIQVLSAGTQGGKSKVDPRDPIDVVFTIDESGSMAYQRIEGPVMAQHSSMDEVTYDPCWIFSCPDDYYRVDDNQRVLSNSSGEWEQVTPDEQTVSYNYYKIDTTIDQSEYIYLEDESLAGRIAGAQSASKNFVSLLNSSAGDRTGVVGFSSRYSENADVKQGLTSNFVDTNASIDNLSGNGGTPLAAGIEEAREEMLNNPSPSPDTEQYMVFLSDGEDSYGTDFLNEAEIADDHNITIYTVGFQISSGGKQNLQDIANATNGTYYPAENTTQLQNQFEKIVAEIKPTLVQNDPYQIGTSSQLFLPNKTVGTASGNVTDYALNDPSIDSDLDFGVSVEDGGKFTLNITEYPCESWQSTNETIRYENGTNVTDSNGNPYYKSACIEANESNPTDISLSSDEKRVKVFTNQNTTADLPAKSRDRPWEQGVREILAENNLLNGSATNLQSNQVVLAYELTASDSNVTSQGDFNDIVLLVDLGYADDEYDVRWAVDIRIAELKVS